jgi:LemA protein
VRGVAGFEQSTLIEVTEARATAVQPVVDINNIDELVDFQERQTGLSQALNRLLMITENYPELSATENFRDLQVQLEGTENRIAVARMDYNNAVESYNISIRKFPGMITATVLNFEQAVRFAADEGAEEAPQVNLTD